MCLDSRFSSLPWAHQPTQGLGNSCWVATQSQGSFSQRFRGLKAGRLKAVWKQKDLFLQKKEGNLSSGRENLCLDDAAYEWGTARGTCPFLLCSPIRPLSGLWQLCYTSFFTRNEVFDQQSWLLGQHEEAQHTSQMTKMRCPPWTLCGCVGLCVTRYQGAVGAPRKAGNLRRHRYVHAGEGCTV